MAKAKPITLVQFIGHCDWAGNLAQASLVKISPVTFTGLWERESVSKGRLLKMRLKEFQSQSLWSESKGYPGRSSSKEGGGHPTVLCSDAMDPAVLQPAYPDA